MSGGWLIDTLIATSLLMALVLLIRRPVARHFGPRLTYALWLIPVARLFIPSLSMEQVPAAASSANDAVRDVVMGNLIIVEQQAAASTAPSAGDVLLALWLCGAGALFFVQMARYLRARRAIITDAEVVEQVGGIKIIASRRVDGPLAFGLIRRFVAVPTDFSARFSTPEQELALAHELAHHRAGDLYANMAGFILLCLQWFSPLAWMSWAAFRLDQEAACDARVLTGRSAEDRHLYGTTLARTASGGIPAFATALNSPKTIIERLRRMTMKDISKRRTIAGKVALATLAVITIPLTATFIPAVAQDGGADAPATQTRVERQVKRVINMGDGAHTQTVERNGTIYTFNSDKPLTDAEIDAKVAEVDEKVKVAVVDADAARGDAVIAVASAEGAAEQARESADEARAAAEGAEKERRRVMVIRKHGDGPNAVATAGTAIAGADGNGVISSADCSGAKPSAVEAETVSADGKSRSKTRIVICNVTDGKADPVAMIKGLRAARMSVSESQNVPEAQKAEVMAKLDARIAELEAEKD